MKTIVVSGATGAIGSALLVALRRAGHQTVTLVRRRSLEGEGRFFYDPEAGEIDARAFDGADGVVHLGGVNLFSGRWNDRLKRRIRDSRLKSTALIARTMKEASHPPPVWISASAVGYYGAAASGEAVDERSPAGDGFLATLCADWERAAEGAREGGVRVVTLRIGLVLDLLLAKVLPLFRAGLGGNLGDGRQTMSWIAMDDLAAAILFLLEHPGVDGPVNAVAPRGATNAEFTALLAAELRRPAFLPVPAPLLRLVLGREMADETVLSDIRAVPSKLVAAGFEFGLPRLGEAIRHAVERG